MTQMQHSTPELLALMQQALAARDAGGAERIAEIVSVREPGHEDVVGFLVGRALARGDTLRALHIARGGLRARPGSARLQFQFGLALGAAGDFKPALDAFRAARTCDPTLLVAPLWQADCEHALGRRDDALRSQLQALNLAGRSGLIPRIATLAPPLRLRVERAIADVQRARRDAIEPVLAPLRDRYGMASTAPSRVCMAIPPRNRRIPCSNQACCSSPTFRTKHGSSANNFHFSQPWKQRPT